jgi:DNA-binding transcriptional LysR family regulator
MDTRQIEYILTIAEESNITRASEKLGLTQPALNQQLLKLEKDLGLQLFTRRHGSLTPTPAGELYLENARKMLLLKKETYQRLSDLSGKQNTTLCIGIPSGREHQVVIGIYAEFHRLYPDCRVTFRYIGSIHDAYEQLKSGDLDFAFTVAGPDTQMPLEYVPVAHEELLLALPEDHPLAAGKGGSGRIAGELSLEQRREEDFSLFDSKGSYLTMLIELQFLKAGFTPHVLMYCYSTSLTLHLIQSGLCLSLLPSFYLETPTPGVAWFHLPERPDYHLYAVFRKNGYRSRMAAEFVKLVTKNLGSGDDRLKS